MGKRLAETQLTKEDLERENSDSNQVANKLRLYSCLIYHMLG